MGTMIRPELSIKNKYWIPKNRYFELKYFCKQYDYWKDILAYLDGYGRDYGKMLIFDKNRNLKKSPGENFGILRARYSSKIDMIDRTVKNTDPIIGKYILQGLLEDKSYTVMRAKIDIPCGRDYYYEAFRRFMWLLDTERD